MLKRIFSTMLIVAMLMISMAACQSGGDPKGSEVQSESSSIEETTIKEKEVIKISVGLYQFQTFDDAMAQVIKDKIKIDIEPIDVSAEGYLNLLAATDDLPDIFLLNTTNEDSVNWIEQKLVREIPSEIYGKFPIVRNIIETNAMLKARAENSGGKVFYVPVPNAIKSTLSADIQGIYFREDWRKQVGIAKNPETVDEMYEVLKAFTFNDPDQNGVNDTYGLSGTIFDPHFMPWGVASSDWVYEDGKWIPGFFSTKALEAMKFYNKLFKEKILDPEFSITGGDQLIDKFARGGCGMMYRVAAPYWLYETIGNRFGAANPDIKNPLESVILLPPLKLNESSVPYWAKFIDRDGTFYAADVDDEKLERCLELQEFLNSEEGFNLRNFGIEGVDYMMKDGVLFNNNAAEGDIRSKYRAVTVYGIANYNYDWTVDPNNLLFPKVFRDLTKKKNEEYTAAALNYNVNFDIKYMSTPKKDKLSMVFDEFAARVVMSEDPVAEYNSIISEISVSREAAAAIEEVNEKAAKMGIKP